MSSKISRGNFKLNISFNLRKHDPATELQDIHAIVRFNNKKIVISGIEKCEPRFWNCPATEERENRGRKVKKVPNPQNYNTPKQSAANVRAAQILRSMSRTESVITELFYKYTDTYKSYPQDLREFQEQCRRSVFNMPDKKSEPTEDLPDDFLKYILYFIDQAKSGRRTFGATGKRYTGRTLIIYKNTHNLLELFCQYSHRKKLPFDAIDLEFYNQFRDYMYNERNFSNNYFGLHIKNIKKFMKLSQKEGYHSNPGFKDEDFVKVQAEAENVYLDTKKLEVLRSLDLSSRPYLENARDLFLLGAWTGLRFGDFSSLNKSHFSGDYIDIITSKTQEPVAIPIHPVVKEIANRYKDRPTGMPRAISNQKLNLFVKEVCKEAADRFKDSGFGDTVKLTKYVGGKKVFISIPFYDAISTHSARRSFASNAIRMGIPETVIKSITGHRSDAAFRLYLKITPREKAEMMREIWTRNELKAI